MRRETFDVVVAGGGAGGVAAAIGAAQAGARTLLVERYGFLGGAATNAQVLSYCGFYPQGPTAELAVGGVGRSVLRGLAEKGLDVGAIRSKSGNWIVVLDSEALKGTLDELVLRSGATLWLHALLVDAEGDGDRLRAVRIADHRGAIEVEAAAFVDASGEADLAARAGVPLLSEAGPDHGGQLASYPVRVCGVPSERMLDRPALTALAARVNARLDGQRIRADGGVFMRLPWSQDLWWMAIDLVTDGLSAPDLTAAEVEARRLAWICVDTLRGIPGFEGARLAASGPQIGIRETRRPRTRATMTREDALAGRRRADGVARACWPMEVHDPASGQVFTPIGGDGVFDVAPDALRAEGLQNLWLGGRTMGADAAAYGSVRVMGTAFATGHAAGVAAALAASGEADPARIRRELLGQDAIL